MIQSPAFYVICFIAFLLVSITVSGLYIGFGPQSDDLRDPFDEHED